MQEIRQLFLGQSVELFWPRFQQVTPQLYFNVSAQ